MNGGFFQLMDKTDLSKIEKTEKIKKEKTDKKENNKNKKDHTDIVWFIKIFFTTFILSIVFSFISSNGITNLSLLPAILILLLVILVGIAFDIVGVAVTVADENSHYKT